MSHLDFTRVFDILEYQRQKYPQKIALSYRLGSDWKNYSIDDIQQKAKQVASWLIANGFQKGDCMAIIPRMGSPLWMMLDFGCQQVGVITVPLHPTATPEEMKFILDEVRAKICIAADAELYEKVKAVFAHPHVYELTESSPRFFPAWNEGKTISNCHIQINPSDILCILYTSGTSGTPKGTVLTHQNVVSNIKSILPLFPIEPGNHVLSFLPFSHIFERTACYTYLAFGASVYFSRELKELSDDLASVKSTFITCVPKTLERMYEFLEEQCQQKNRLKRKLVTWAMRVGEQYRDDARRGFLFGLKLFLARVLVLNAWRKALSSKIKYVVVGAAALRPEIGRLFSAAGVMTLSGYGMTEASPFIAVNRPEPGMNKFGTVGLPVPGVELKLDNPNEAGEGEILVRGPNIMQGYFNRPELNAEVFTDGWLRTGDIGKMVSKRFLAITGRKKDIFKTTAGIYIAPQELESHLAASPFISQSLVYGFNKPFVAAVLVPHTALLQSWCEENAIHWTSLQFMVHNIKVIQKFQQEVDRLNELLPNYKRIKKFLLTDMDWTVENGMLTPSFKMIRGKIQAHYQTELDKLFE